MGKDRKGWNSLLSYNSPSFSTFYPLFSSTLSTLPSLFLLSTLLFPPSYPSRFHAFPLLPSSICVLWVAFGEKVRGIFPQLGRTRTQPQPQPPHHHHHPRTLIFCLSLHSLCLMSEGSLEENHPYSTTKVFWMFAGTLRHSLFHRHQLWGAMATH